MSIFILEDDIIQAESLKQMIKEICAKRKLAYDFIETTSRSEQIIEKIPFTSNIPIYFLDIEIKSEKRRGLEVAQKIRQYDTRGIIVFITTHSEFAPISYQYMVSALSFIDKSLPTEERYQLVEECLLHYQKCNLTTTFEDDFIVENGQATVRVPFSTVSYIKTDQPHRLVLITSERIIHFYGRLKEIEKLDERLLRCHQSFVVNTMNIASFDISKRLLTLNNHEQIPVSRRLSRKVQQVIRG